MGWTPAQGRCTAATSPWFGEPWCSILRRSSASRKQFSLAFDCLRARRFSVSSRDVEGGRWEREGYVPSSSQANQAPYEYSRVSVPESVRDSPFLGEMLDVEDIGIPKGYEMRMLQTPEALAKIARVRREFLPHQSSSEKGHSNLRQGRSENAWSGTCRLQFALCAMTQR